MTQLTIAFTGISGVGKTTFLQSISSEMPFQHLTGGSLIAAAREVPEDKRDDLRHIDLDENQKLLVQGFAIKRDPHADIVIMDGHVIIDGTTGITEIDGRVFSDLGVNVMVHLEANPEQIFRNRGYDSTRNRPGHSIDILKTHQDHSKHRAMEIARELGISFIPVSHSDTTSFVRQVRILQSQ